MTYSQSMSKRNLLGLYDYPAKKKSKPAAKRPEVKRQMKQEMRLSPGAMAQVKKDRKRGIDYTERGGVHRGSARQRASETSHKRFVASLMGKRKLPLSDKQIMDNLARRPRGDWEPNAKRLPGNPRPIPSPKKKRKTQTLPEYPRLIHPNLRQKQYRGIRL